MKTKLTIVAQDANSPLVRNEIWVGGVRRWPTMFKLPFPMFGIVARKDMIRYAIDADQFERAKQLFLTRVRRSPNLLLNVMRQSEIAGKEMNAFTSSVRRTDLTTWTPTMLRRFYIQYIDLQRRQYAIGVLLPPLDLIGERVLEVMLEREVRRAFPAHTVSGALTTLSTPTRNSFALDQEHGLLMLGAEWCRNEDIRKVLRNGTPTDVIALLRNRYPDQLDALDIHVRRWDWVYYVYAGPAWGRTQFIAHLQELIRTETPAGVIRRRTLEQRALRKERTAYLSRLRGKKNTRRIIALLEMFIWSKPRRKDYQSRSYRDMEYWYREIGRRTKLPLDLVRSATITQLTALARCNSVARSTLRQQRAYHITIGERRSIKVLRGKDARAFEKKYVVEETHAINSGTSLKGSTAYPGIVGGTVRLVYGPSDMKKMKRGDILVSPATTPSVVPAMKLAGAIVTDEGGLTCHAAIVSRELKKPCVVGTKVATKVLKDGDRVEVDANNGIVRKL